MKNKDFTMTQAQLEITQRFVNAVKAGNTEEFEASLQDLFTNIHDQVIDQAEQFRVSADRTILAQRGIRQLTAAETKFYQTFIDAAKADGAKMALTNADKTFPETIINQVMEDMVQAHPLLAAVDVVNTTGLTRFLVNTDEGTKATWGDITDTITKEITSGFDEVDLSQMKLSAFLPIDLAMLDLGPVWLDSYIRTCLSEALAAGYEVGIVSGTGVKQPIGMDKDLSKSFNPSSGYTKKTAKVVTEFTPTSYGALIAPLAKNAKGKPRAVTGLIMVVSPFDYFKLVMPATTLMTPDGHYANDVLPVPTQIIQSVAVTEGQALLGMGKKYFLGMAGSRGIQFSDDFKFLDDKRYYKITAYANGKPKDNNSFELLDISKLAPKYLTVNVNNNVEGVVTTKAQA